MLSGNTDCYQPLEREMKITQAMLEVLLRYRHPVGIVTKNSLILRDIDLLKELAALRLVGVFITITTLDEDLRRVMEPRTASSAKRFETVKQLNEAGIPTGVFMAPIIPGLNHHEIPALIEKAAEHGAPGVAYTVVRLNGQVEKIFKDWLEKNFPDRFNKVWNQIEELHGGTVGDTQFGRRMKGEGQVSEMIRQLYRASKKKHLTGRHMPNLDLTKFRRQGNLMLFD
jgi:DNA repair photolyase